MVYGAREAMTAIIIVGLVGVAFFFGGGWFSSRNEISQLRIHVAALKRQLARQQTLN